MATGALKAIRVSAKVEIAIAFLLILPLMSCIEFAGPAILDNDGYYHIRWASLMRESAPSLPRFGGLPLTTLNERDYADHHFLYHVLLIPFTFGDLRSGAKWSAAIFSSLALAAMFSLLVLHKVAYRWLWLAPLVASSGPFLYRMSMTRAPALSLALLAIGAHLILKRRLAWLAVLAFAFTWAYSLFPLIVMLAIAYAIAVYASQLRVDLGPALAAGLGVALGLVVNPYFPRNVTLFWEHLKMKLAANYAVSVGVEWYPYETWVLLGTSAVAFAIFGAALIAFDFRKLRDVKPLFLLVVALVFLLLLFRSRRFVEYWPPFAVVFAAFSLAPVLEKLKEIRIPRLRDRAIASVAAASISVAALGTMGFTLLNAGDNVRSEASPYAYRGAAEWLKENSPEGARIFNTDWDDFPMLFYYNPAAEYIAGLDPTYLYDRDRGLWDLYARITLGQEPDPAPLIRERFEAEYVFTDNEHAAFLNVAANSGDFETVYRDRYATVLRIGSR